MATDKKGISTDSYKGVRDFYPEDMALQNHIFRVFRTTVESFGYREYSASTLEPAELYRAKSGEEIVNEQTYTFTDRGDREVTLRPEMTPTVARMVAAKRKELSFPLRWYSIPNLFRYEQPQRGRLREHWQLNVDMFGAKTIDSEVEMLSIASSIMSNFGLKDADFEIRINSRKIMNYLMQEVLALPAEKAQLLSKLIDRREKMPREEFAAKAREIADDKSDQFLTILNSQNFEEFASHLPASESRDTAVAEVHELLGKLSALGIENARFDQTLMRGFDYYTGIVFEVFDTNPKNRRSVFGGGRYDDLLDIFDQERVPAVGFGAGDVVIADILESYGLVPPAPAPADLSVAIADSSAIGFANDIASELREAGIRTTVDYSGRKVGDQLKAADKQSIPFVVVIGTDEVASGSFKVKNLKTGVEEVCPDTTTAVTLIKKIS
jgi:histidyl-tRNA synthetase